MANEWYSELLNELKQVEGIWSNHPKDSGGETVFGIARKHWPDWEGWGRVDLLKGPDFPENLMTDHITQYNVKVFYRSNFYVPSGAYVAPSKAIARELFDTAVNQGAGKAVEYLQRALNLLNRNQKDYQDIKPDGIWGDATRGALDAYWATSIWRTRSPRKNEKVLLKALNGFQLLRYIDIAKHKPDQEVFFYGWVLHRVD